MAAGTATVQILDLNTTTIKDAMEALRASANDKWMLASSANGRQVILAHMEEA